jgi:hypothetical protein
MTAYLKITNFDKLDINKVKYILQNHLKDILLTEILFESDHILIPHKEPETLQELDWTILGSKTETYALKPTPRQNLHKGIPTYITEESYKDMFIPNATQIRRLTKEGRPLPTLEITFPTARAQLEDLHTTTRLGKTQIKKQIATTSGSIQCSICLQLKPRKNHANCILTCSYCAQRGHIKLECEYYKTRDTYNRLCATCGEDHEASNCPQYLQLKTTLMERRQAKAIKQLQTDADEERLLLEEQKNELEVDKPLKRKRMADHPLEPQHLEDTYCPHCQRSFNPIVLSKHIPKCITSHQRRDKLKQSTISNYKNE